MKTIARRSLLSLTSLMLIAGAPVSPILAQAPLAPNTPVQTLAPVPISAPLPGIGDPSAPDQITLTAIPPRLGEDLTLMAKPGEKIQAVVEVRNSSEEPMTISSLVQDFVVGEDGKTPIPVGEETSNRWSLAAWTELSPATQILQPRQSGKVNLVIDVPADALPGGHYAMVLHEPLSNAATDENGNLIVEDTSSRVAQRVGTLVYFVVEGPINEEAFIRNVQFPSLTEYGPVPFSFMIENVSDIHIKPKVTVDIYNIFGQHVDSLVIEPQNVFPFVARQFEGQWDRVWGIGPYQAKLTMTYGSQGRTAMAATSFWLIPYKLVLAALAVILIIIALIFFITKMIKKRGRSEQARVKALEERLHELENQNNHSARE